MKKLFILLAIYDFAATIFVFLLTIGTLKPMPWMPVFFILMLVFGVVALRSKEFDRLISYPPDSKFVWKYLVFLIWAMVSFGGAFYGILLWISGHGTTGDLGGAIGATVWGFVLVWLLRIAYKKNQVGIRTKAGSAESQNRRL